MSSVDKRIKTETDTLNKVAETDQSALPRRGSVGTKYSVTSVAE